jgi:hypothetical protein
VWSLSPVKPVGSPVVSSPNEQLTEGNAYYFYFTAEHFITVLQFLDNTTRITTECTIPIRLMIRLHDGSFDQYIMTLTKLISLNNQGVAFTFVFEKVFILQEWINATVEYYASEEFINKQTKTTEEKVIADSIDTFVQQEMFNYQYAQSQKEDYSSPYLVTQNNQLSYNRRAMLYFIFGFDTYQENGYGLQKAPVDLRNKKLNLQFSANATDQLKQIFQHFTDNK